MYGLTFPAWSKTLSFVLAMLRVSFRLVSSRSFPRYCPSKPACCLVVAVLLAGCGGSARSEHTALQRVDGPGYSFSAPETWRVTRTVRAVTAASGGELVSVTVFRLARPYRPSLWPTVVPVLNGVAAQLARGLGGSVDTRETVVLAGLRARRYEIAFRRGGKDVVERIVFLLEGRREYQLLCRYARGGGSEACSAFLASFKPA
jgi:hypothetical protein